MSADQLWPILFGVSLCINGILLFGKHLLRRDEKVSEDNIMAMVEEGEESGSIQSSEKELIENVFEFDTMTAKDVMIHRTDMVILPLDAGEDEVVEASVQSGLSRWTTSWVSCPPGTIC